jgi:phenylalanyl-tRNA synthetase beta chain
MRVPLSWLREVVDVPADASPEDVHAALVRVGLEEEDVHSFDITGPVVVGRVISVEPEPQSNGKTINWCQVDVGESEPRGIVCGAHNFGPGDAVVVSLPGAVLPGPFPISARKTYGHVSDGMIASARELGLGDEHSGILRLADLGLDPQPGTDAIALLGLDDAAVEVNVTPDRGYAFSIRGIGREYANSTGAAYRDPLEEPVLVAAAAERRAATGYTVTVADEAPVRGRPGCVVFTTGIIRGVDATRPTPPWMVARLLLAGMRPVSLIVDISNYVMLELGQPSHTYDLAKVAGGLVVRRARPGERLTTLDGKERTLDPEDLVVADESVAVGLAGVMGGLDTEISSATTDVLVEAAVWEPVTVSRTVRRHRLPSEAAKRYERGVDPAASAPAVARVLGLIEQLAGGTVDRAGSYVDASVAPQPIELPEVFPASLTGVSYSATEITGALVAIGARVESSDSGWTVTPPTWRPDLTDRWGLVEEIARIVGYDRVDSVLPVAPPGRGLSRAQKLRRTAATSLAAAGLTEVLAYPFVAEEANDRFGSPVAGRVPAMRIANPIDPDAAWLRTSLLPGLIATARRNLSRGLTDLALFEMGTVFRPAAGAVYGSDVLPAGHMLPDAATLQTLLASVPPQPWHVAALFLGDAVGKQPGQPAIAHGLADALATVRQLSAVLSVEISVQTGQHQSLHPGRTAELVVGETVVGYAGELLPALADELDLPRVVAVVELDLDALIASAATSVSARPIGTFPAATQDLSLVVSESVPAGDLLALIREGAGDLLEHATLVDDYRGPGVPGGSKSLTFALRFRASDRTLTAAEATEAKNAAVALAAARVGAALRE